ncbi:MAG: hypothetical protein K2X81_26940 [Candidatus Obscuribacterales bacterium]|nr:hypothetical protein [Candidatus Obscuribacterales bacterium]
MCKVSTKVLGLLIASFAITIAASTPARADLDSSLIMAQEMEAEGQYSAAACAYLSMIEGFDFMPGVSETANLSREEKTILGKCAVESLERGLEKHFTGSQIDKTECSELMLLPVVFQTMSELEPLNPKWTTLKSLRLTELGVLY